MRCERSCSRKARRLCVQCEERQQMREFDRHGHACNSAKGDKDNEEFRREVTSQHRPWA